MTSNVSPNLGELTRLQIYSPSGIHEPGTSPTLGRLSSHSLSKVTAKGIFSNTNTPNVPSSTVDIRLMINFLILIKQKQWLYVIQSHYKLFKPS